jgi:hypothetical protein
MQIVLFCVFVPLILTLIQAMGPYEDVRGEDYAHTLFKVITQDAAGLHVIRYLPSRFSSVEPVDYLTGLEKGNGVVKWGNSVSTYSISKSDRDATEVTLRTDSEFFRYEIRASKIYPREKKIIGAWKIIFSLAGAGIIILFGHRLMQHVHKKRVWAPFGPGITRKSLNAGCMAEHKTHVS